MKLSEPEWIIWNETKALVRAFGDVPVRFVGGAVRDCLLGIKAQDVDLATPLLPSEVILLLAKAGIKAIPTGIDHGTVTAVIGKRHFEITTLRRDVSTDGRRATVAYTDDWREDAKRRDFTMNALYCDVHGEISDYFNGIEDAKTGRVRFIGDANERIDEDALRILRFFRFFAYYGRGTPDAEALTACSMKAAKIDHLSGERIAQEMLKLLVAPQCAEVIRIMQDKGILQHVIHGQVSTQALSRLPALFGKLKITPDAMLILASLLHGKESDTKKRVDMLVSRWRLSNAQQKWLEQLASGKWVTGTNEKGWKKQIRAMGRDLFVKYTILLMAEGADETNGMRAIEFASKWNIPSFPLTGEHLISHGMKPGKDMGLLLKKLEEFWEEKDYAPDKEALLRYSDSLKQI